MFFRKMHRITIYLFTIFSVILLVHSRPQNKDSFANVNIEVYTSPDQKKTKKPSSFNIQQWLKDCCGNSGENTDTTCSDNNNNPPSNVELPAQNANRDSEQSPGDIPSNPDEDCVEDENKGEQGPDEQQQQQTDENPNTNEEFPPIEDDTVRTYYFREPVPPPPIDRIENGPGDDGCCEDDCIGFLEPWVPDPDPMIPDIDIYVPDPDPCNTGSNRGNGCPC